MSRDLRRYARNTNIQLVFGGLALAFIVGVGLIYVFYGPASAISGALCMLVGMGPLFLIWFALLLLDWVVRRANKD